MSKIKNTGTGPEKMLRKELWKKGVKGYRIKSNLPGKPDIVFTRQKVAIFVDGCFWHACPQHSKIPESNNLFWFQKIESNRNRDKHVNELLYKMGWNVLRFWEHQIKNELNEIVEKIRKCLARQKR